MGDEVGEGVGLVGHVCTTGALQKEGGRGWDGIAVSMA